jgi:hypothetical protein
MHRLFSLFAAALLVTGPHGAVAQDDAAFGGPVGFAYAQAPEAGSGECFGLIAIETMECAQQACAEASGLPLEHCNVDIWCAPHGFVADIFMQHREGPHWHAIVCGGASREELEQLVAVKCEAEWLIECLPVRIWNADGELVEDIDG